MQVISNLLGNALEHGKSDTPVNIEIDGTVRHEIAVKVSNHGEVEETVIAEIFQPFRTITSGKGPTQGLGLGLYIVKKFTEAHQGKVIVRSGEGKTIFELTFPRKICGKSQGANIL
jgi:two-component system sensor histidine kinase/response regulator